MTTRKELNKLLTEYEGHIGTGSMQRAGRLLPAIVRKLVSLLDEQYERKIFVADVGDMATEEVKEKIAQVCPPCDVSLPNNPALIAEFKEPQIVEKKARKPAVRKTPVKKVDEAPAPKTRRKPKITP